MNPCERSNSRPLMLVVAGAKGAVASTLAVAAAAVSENPALVLDYMTTGKRFPYLGDPNNWILCGWDNKPEDYPACLAAHGIVPKSMYAPHLESIGGIEVKPPPDASGTLDGQIEHLMADIGTFVTARPGALPVLINLLPACEEVDAEACEDPGTAPCRFPDMAYVLAAIQSGIPVVNFTPNKVETPGVCRKAEEYGVPLAGRDGKTGQTFFKVALASALKSRHLYVDGWYSLNILGNADGKNLMDPCRAEGKVRNKTRLLDEILGYTVGERYGEPTHTVCIDYYPPRGDAKEAWDAIDFRGLFGLPMSLRLNLQGRDSILAAPMVLDLARWVSALHLAGYTGPVSELGFYFKRPVGDGAPVTFQAQVAALERLEQECDEKILAMTRRKPPGKAP